MKRVTSSLIRIGVAVLLTSCATRNAAQTAGAPAYPATPAPAYGPAVNTSASGGPFPGSPSAGLAAPAPAASWPLVFTTGASTYALYEPLCDSWDGHQLKARSAVAVQSPGQSDETFGVVTFSATTLVDKGTRTATLADIKVAGVDFPSAPGQAAKHLAGLRRELPQHAPALSLDRLEPNLNLAPPLAAKAEPLNNIPPKIIIASRPALLVYVDGPPVWRPVPGTSLERVFNARDLLLRDPSGRYYLHLFDGYLQAASLDGPWTIASQPPAGAETAENVALSSGQTDLLRGEPDAATQQPPSLKSGPAPDVFVASTPSELLTFNGQPSFVAIPGTQLLYAANTSGNVFKLLTRSAELRSALRSLVSRGFVERAVAIRARQSVAAGLCQHSRRQPEGEREGQRGGNAAGGRGAHRQQHPAKRGHTEDQPDAGPAGGRRPATGAHRRHPASLRGQQQHADHRS